MKVLWYLLYCVVCTYTLWGYYLAAMHLRERQKDGTLTKQAAFFGWPLVWTGLVVDFLCNVTVMTVVFLEIPQEMTVTERLKRHIAKDEGGWRKSVACWFRPVLNPFDPDGSHIG